MSEGGADGGGGDGGRRRSRSRSRGRRRRGEAELDSIGNLLEPLLRKFGIHEEVARQDVLVRWEKVVGERIASVTRASAVDGEVLFVEVASSAWLNELNLLRHDILRQLNAGQGNGRVERIVFRLAERPHPRPREQ